LNTPANTVGFYISAILFSIGSLIFFYLFFKSAYIPQIISIFGIFASVMVTLVGFAMLISPNLAGVIQFGWLPMIIAEIATGVWLLFKGLRPIKVPSNLIN
jgi:NADH:ubiquinone oxidoreductase subunit K